MNRYFESLRPGDRSVIDLVPDGLLLARVERAQYRWHAQKPYYLVSFAVIEPRLLADYRFTSRLYCTPKALWKLNWFLREFGYDTELLAKGAIDDQLLVGLEGVVKVSYVFVRGLFVLNLDGFAPSSKWNGVSPLSSESPGSEVA